MHEFYQYQEWEEKGDDQIDIPKHPQHFDVIILDLNMPILNGFEACK